MTKNAAEAKKIIGENSMEITEAIAVLKKASFEKFDTTFSASLDLNLDVRKAEQQMRGSIVLPHGTGKTVKVLAIVDGAYADAAKTAGAEMVEGISFLAKIENDGKFDFDIIVTTPNMMPELSKYGKMLGTKGLMPNPKLGSVSEDIKQAVTNAKSGQAEIRNDKDGNIGVSIGKKSFHDDQLLKNFHAILDTLEKEKGNLTLKGDLIKNTFITSSMGVSYKVKLGKAI